MSSYTPPRVRDASTTLQPLPHLHHLLLNPIHRILLRSILHLNTLSRTSRTHLLQLLLPHSMRLLIILDDLRVDRLELGLESGVAGRVRGAVGAAARLGGVEVVVFEFGDAFAAPRGAL